MNFKRTILKIVWILIFFNFSQSSALSNTDAPKIMDKIINCRTEDTGKLKMCTIQTQLGKKGTRVTFFDEKRYWVATGKIFKKRGNRAVVFIKDHTGPIPPSYYVAVGSVKHWMHAFSKTEDTKAEQ